MTGSESAWLGFALAVLIIELTPGPNMAWLAGLALAEGRRPALAATAGVALGLTCNGLLAAAGLAALIATEPRLASALGWLGTAFMLWLAWQAWRDSGTAASLDRQARSGMTRHFLAGLTVNLLNPKAFLFFAAVAPRFFDGRMPTIAQAISLTAISVGIATAVHLLLVTGAAHVHGLVADPSRTRLIRRIMAIAMVGVAIWFAAGALR